MPEFGVIHSIILALCIKYSEYKSIQDKAIAMRTWCRAILVSCILSVMMLNLSYADEDIPVHEFKVGVLANHGVLQAKQRWQPMMDYLSENVPNSRFEVVPVDFNGMRSQLLSNELQFIVTNPGQYLHLSNNFPLSWLATMKSRKHQGSTFTIGPPLS